MRIFISHKLEDAATANLIAKELQEIKVECYLDLLDNSITENGKALTCLLYTSPSPRDGLLSRMPSSA